MRCDEPNMYNSSLSIFNDLVPVLKVVKRVT